VNCEQTSERLNAWADGELDAPSAAALDAHLTACADCRHQAQSLRGQQADLRRAFAPRRQAAEGMALRVAALIAHEPPPARIPPPADERPRPIPAGAWSMRAGWRPMLAAAAAGFLLAVLIFRPWDRPMPVAQQPTPGDQTPTAQQSTAQQSTAQRPTAQRPTTDSPHTTTPPSTTTPAADEDHPPLSAPVARLAISTGDVELRPASLDQWAACSPSTAIEPGTTVRTGPGTQCEIPSLLCPADVRLNADTVVRYVDDSRIELDSGQLWSAVRDGGPPLEVRADNTTVSARDATFEMSCSADQTLLTVLVGTAQVEDKAGRTTVEAGHQVTIVDGVAGAAQRHRDPLLGAGWMDALLIAKGTDNPELNARLDDLLARLGEAKMSYLYEQEIRRLGDFGVPPLVRYIHASADQPHAVNHAAKRAAAARIVADVAQPRWIPDLIDWLADADPQVRFHAALGLRRLTSQDQGLTPEQWRDEPADTTLAALHAWQDWWQTHHDRYPGARKPDVLSKQRAPGQAPRAKG
jgi:hypothetical protein